MENIILTSTGFSNEKIEKKFLKILNKPISEIKVIFIPTASRTEDELKYVNESKEELFELGVLKSNVKVLNLENAVSFKDVEGFDVIYVCGGNTFFLLKKVRESGFDKIIQDFVNSGKLYFGVSAGSILVCPDVDIASPFDENDVNLSDLSGLNLIDVIVSPHFCDEDIDIINEFEKRSKFKIIRLTDDEALVFEGENMEIIG